MGSAKDLMKTVTTEARKYGDTEKLIIVFIF